MRLLRVEIVHGAFSVDTAFSHVSHIEPASKIVIDGFCGQQEKWSEGTLFFIDDHHIYAIGNDERNVVLIRYVLLNLAQFVTLSLNRLLCVVSP